MIERWHDTQLHFKRKDPKRVYFLSLEYLMGIYALFWSYEFPFTIPVLFPLSKAGNVIKRFSLLR